MIRLRTLLPLLAALVVALPAMASDPLTVNPFHNFVNPRDVDDNGLVTSRDLLLVFDALHDQQADPLARQLAASEQYYWDTNNSGTLTPNDGLIIINHLLRAQSVPEPASLVTGGIALAGLAGFCWRRRKRAVSAR